MANIMVCCGGTGAHVALAFMRLHALGHPLGFFHDGDGHRGYGRPLELPTIYLVDQDSGDRGRGETAWQALRRVVAHHPSRSEWGETAGARRKPVLDNVITPLPVGPQEDWFKGGNDQLESRFEATDYLACMASPRQRRILFSRGMMGSPAVGSLLFRLKAYDCRDDGINHDATFDALCQQTGRVVVVGSGVGGTGSSVAPTLSQTLADQPGAEVMAVMILNWFKLDEDPNNSDRATVRKAKARNRDMDENANSGLQYYGRNLAEEVATVPVGVPERALRTRPYEGDTRQPLFEAYPHAVAALACMRQYLSERPFTRGLYHMGAADSGKLGGGNRVPGGTLQSLANQGEVLARTADVLANVLTARHRKGPFAPAILDEVKKRQGKPGAVGEALRGLVKEYRDHLRWLNKMGVDRRPQRGLTREADVGGRLAMSPPERLSDARPEAAASELFRWIARWVRDEAGSDAGLSPGAEKAGGIYWPPLRKEGLGGAAGEAGRLKKLPTANVEAVIEGFVDPGKTSQNGWPNAFAAASHFEWVIEGKDPTALRKLELLMAGLVAGRLEMRLNTDGDPRPISLERIIEDERKRLGGSLARYSMFGEGTGADARQLFGFSSPHTLFCEAPGVSDDAWGRLWSELTGLSADEWRPRSLDEWKACDSWGNSNTIVAKIRAWMEACMLRHRHGTTPAWTRIFRGVSLPESTRATFGAGLELELRWDRHKVTEYLPTMQSGDWPIDYALPEGDEAGFLQEHGVVRNDTGELRYETVTFRIPGEDADKEVRGIWKAHLERLLARGSLVAFGSNPRLAEVYVVMHREDGVRERIVLPKTVILDRQSMMIRRIVPMEQDPVPGEQLADEVLYPDLPLKSDYLDLVQVPGGRSALDLLKQEQGFELPNVEIGARQGGDVAVWSVAMRGRKDDVRITLRLPPKESFHKAHWMVWPKFRVLEPEPWRAYYVYGHCTDPRLGLDTLYLDPDRDRVLVSRNDRDDRPSYPIRYDALSGVHTGGPPIAFSLRDTSSDEDLGIYFVSLSNLQELPESVRIGVDFGTSHSVGAVKVGQDSPRQIELAPELDPAGRDGSLSKHVSQNWGHVKAPAADLGLLSQSVWTPNYVEGVPRNLKSLLPTELLTIEPFSSMARKTVQDWVPMLDFVVPPVGISRQDFVDHVIANFKWDTANAFRGYEQSLRRIYLDRVVELFTAEILAGFGHPDQAIGYTFTYPLRTPKDDVNSYVKMLRDVMERASSSTGCQLTLAGDVGIFDESHAVRVGTGKFGEVCLVGDLGGGTLDLIISAHERPGVKFDEAVDSVKIGGGLLLRALAEELGAAMPDGWARKPGKRAAQLTAWMRAVGARRLFGHPEGAAPVIEGLGLRGFSNPEEARPGRELIHRYFYLVGEYMARSLTAYLGRHWYPRVDPRDWEELRIRLYLRGNGWRLWPESDDYRSVEKVIADRVSTRLSELWRLLPSAELPVAPRNCRPGGDDSHPKRGPVRQVVGRHEARSDMRGLSYTMVDLRILMANGEERVPWCRRIPVPTRGRGVKIQLGNDGLLPPIPLNSREADRHLQLARLSEKGENGIHDLMDREGRFLGPELLDFEAPVGAWVWEAAFKSGLLRKGVRD